MHNSRNIKQGKHVAFETLNIKLMNSNGWRFTLGNGNAGQDISN